MSKVNINIYYKDVEEPVEFENMDSFKIVKGGKFLFLFANLGTGLEYYVLMENVLYFEIEYKEEGEK